MTYPEAVAHLYSLAPELAPTPGGGPVRKFDLDHMRTLCAHLGNPQDRVPAVLIAGTNGKGSTAATLASILAAAGLRVGLYTSPHLIRPNERIQLARPVLPSEYGNLVAHTDGPLQLTEIADADFARLYTEVDQACTTLTQSGQLPILPSFFERLTALAFLFYAGQPGAPGLASETWDRTTTKFNGVALDPRVPHSSQPHRDEWDSPAAPSRSSKAEQSATIHLTPAEILILEVGLGGRLDATNIVTPILSVMTDIALDHQEYLGHTIAAITAEKCGILRPGVPLVTLPQLPEANHAIGLAATALGVPAINAADYIPPPTRSDDTPLSAFNRDSPSATPQSSLHAASRTTTAGAPPSAAASSPVGMGSLGGQPLPPNHYILNLDQTELHVDSPLPGHHQQRNIALAIAAALELRKRFPIPTEAIEAGIRKTRWPGRLESFPLPERNQTLLLDVAHNPAGAWTLRSAIAALSPDQPRTLIFSCLRDKSLEEMSRILFPLFDSSGPDRPHDHILLAPINSPRAAHVDDLLAAAHALQVPAHASPHLAAALHQAQLITPPGGLILATGSVYLVGEIRQLALTQQP